MNYRWLPSAALAFSVPVGILVLGLQNIFVPFGTMYLANAYYSSGNLYLNFPATVALTSLTIFLALFLSSLKHQPVQSGFRFLMEKTRTPVFVCAVASIMFVMTQLVSGFVLEHHPRDVDHVARIFQAKTFASGQLSIDAPANVPPLSFSVFGVIVHDGQMFSKYAPGAALVFSITEFVFGTSLVINAILGVAGSVLLFHAFAHYFDDRTARLALLFMLLSPAYIFMISSMHSHVPSMFFCAVVIFLLSRVKTEDGFSWRLLAAGFAGGLGLITREFTTTVLLLPLVLFFLWGRPALAPARIGALVLGASVPIAFLLFYNNTLTGSPWLSTFLLADPEQLPWSGGKGHTFEAAVRNTVRALILLNVNLLGWPTSFLFLPFIVLSRSPYTWVFVACCASLVIGYAGFYWMDFSFGVRYYFEGLPLLFALFAVGFWKIYDRLTFGRFGAINSSFIVYVAFLGFVFSATIYTPKLAYFYANDYNGNVDTRVDEFAPKLNATPAMVFVAPVGGENGGYEAGFLANPLNLRELSDLDKQRSRIGSMSDDSIIYARDLGLQKNILLMSEFPARNYFEYRYDPLTGAGTFTPIDRLGRTLAERVQYH